LLNDHPEHKNKDIYIADYEHLGIYGCRILIPGLSEIYPIDELYWQNNNEGLIYRERILSLNKMDNAQACELLQDIQQSEFSDHSDICGLIGIAADPDSVWETLRVGELKGMLALHTGDYRQAIEWAQWCLDMGQLPSQRNKFYHALIALLEIQLDNKKDRSQYLEALHNLYGQPIIERCIALINNQNHYDGLFDAGMNLNGFEHHHSLLAAYEKLQLAKRNYVSNTRNMNT